MKFKINIFFLSLFAFSATINFIKAQTSNKHYIQLTDKNNNPYSITNPSQFLSAKAIQRRTNQNIAINKTDLPVNPTYISQIKNTGATVLYSIKWFNGVVVQVPDTNVLNAIRALPFVSSNVTVNIQRPDKSFEKIEDLPPSTQKISNSNSVYDYGNSLNQIEMLNGVCMHDAGFTGSGITIAILDGGFANANTHPTFSDLRANNQIIGTKDFTFTAPIDVYSSSTIMHGTAVLGTMAANTPGQLVGTAPKANYWLIRSEYAPTEYLIEEYNWAAAAEFADSVGADIINSSLGYNQFDNPTQDHTISQLDGKTSIASKAATMCARKGMIVCNSAGNQQGWIPIAFPADADSILTVGGVDASRNLASFSSTGPTADGRIKPDVVAQAMASVIANSSGGISTSNGTSFSSPITAGMVACLWQAAPTKTNMEIINAIKESASLYTTPNNQYGYGIPDFCKAKNILVPPPDKNAITLASANPFKNEIILSVSSLLDRTIKVEITDILGRAVFTSEFAVTANTFSKCMIQSATMSVGTYIIKAYSTENDKDLMLTLKLIKAD